MIMRTKIAFYRNKLNITQEQLGQAVDVTRQTIISLEQGKYNPSLQLAYKITKALKMRSIEDVFILKD
ncbi:MAG: helix-turn-helix transcriptional regulator [Candidatus Woesearchaeota archaeon]